MSEHGANAGGDEFEDEEYLYVEDGDDPLNVPPPAFEDPEAENGSSSEMDVSSSESVENNVTEPSVMRININLSPKELKNYKFHFIGAFYSRMFKTQHLSNPVLEKDVFGDSADDLMAFLWEISAPHLSREAVVETTEEGNTVRWSVKEHPDVTDLNKFVVLKHEQNKRLFSIEEIESNERMITSWRGKRIQVHMYKYSTAITSNTLWAMVNKDLIHPEKKDRAGAPSTEEVFECIESLKEGHSHLTALYASWEKWANYILAQPGDQRSRLMSEAPPDDYLHLFRSAPISEASQLQCTRQGLRIAFSVNDSLISSVTKLCDRMDALSASVSEAQIEMHELKTQVATSRSLLRELSLSMPPEEVEFSRKLASRISNMEDIDHQP